jgi:predicted transposase YdaD
MLRSNKKVKERIGETMGGKVLELESERLIKKGRREGREIKLVELIKKKLAKGKDIDTIADELEESVEEVKRLMDKLD